MEENESNHDTYVKSTDFLKSDNYKRNYSKKIIKVSGMYNTILVLNVNSRFIALINYNDPFFM